jgi:arabinofuranosyltransferase
MERRSRARRRVQRGLFAIPVVIFLAVGWAHRWTYDDGFIYLRIVRQVRVGNGPVFNAGERVEAYTSPLWVAMLAVGDLVTPVRLEWLAVLAGLALGGAGLWFAMAASRRLWFEQPEPSTLVVPFGAIVFIAILPTWVFATSGLETGLSFAWLGAALWILAEWAHHDDRLSLPRAFVLGMGWLVRPELVLFSALFLFIVLAVQWRDDRWRDRLQILAAFVAVPFAYQLFRMGYFGSVVTNTAIAKEGSRANFPRGNRYLRDFVDTYWLWLPALVLVGAGYVPMARAWYRDGRRRAPVVVGAFVAAALANGFYVVAVGGDYIHGRLFLPAFFALCAPVAVIPARRRYLPALVAAPWVAAAFFVMRPDYVRGPFLDSGFVLPRASGYVTVDDYGWGTNGPERRWYDGPAFYGATDGGFRKFDGPLKPELHVPTVAVGGIGKPGYALGPDVDILDFRGLAETLTAHLDAPVATGRVPLPGHEKTLPPPWIAALVTPEGAAVAPEDFPKTALPMIPPTTGAAFDEQVAWARAALRCDEIADLREASEGSLGPRRWLVNLVAAPANSRVRIPPDPEAAYRKFCGDDTPAEVTRVRQARDTG